MKISIQKERPTGSWWHLERPIWSIKVDGLEVGSICAHSHSPNTTYYWAMEACQELGLPHTNKAREHLTLKECKVQAKVYIKKHCQKTNAIAQQSTNT